MTLTIIQEHQPVGQATTHLSLDQEIKSSYPGLIKLESFAKVSPPRCEARNLQWGRGGCYGDLGAELPALKNFIFFSQK